MTNPTRTFVDPITLEVIQHGVVSICDQIDANVTRTAFSPYIYEYKDFSVGMLGPDGELVAQSTGGIPIFVADSIGAAVRDGLHIFGKARLLDGDVIVCNHAAVQGQHLNNTVMYTPIYSAATLIGFFAINVHWIDIGGAAIGSHSPKSSDIFMEGLQLRSIKLWNEGSKNEDVYRIIENNTRFPIELMGDIAAQLAGCLLGRDMVKGLAAKYGAQTYLAAVARILDLCEASTREQVRAIRNGVYEAESILDNDGVSDVPIQVKIKVVVADDEVVVDYSEIGAQTPGPINSGYYGGGQTAARLAFKYLIATNEVANEGTFRPLKIILPDGKFLSASPTAPMGHYSSPLPTVIDTIIRALGKAAPELATGAHFGSFSGFGFKGRRPGNGAFYRCHDSGHGGWGASGKGDGSGPFRTMAHGDTRIIPVELQESNYPFRVESFSLREDSGGPGTYRGGLGIRKRYRVLEDCTAVLNFERSKCAPWGAAGGCEGKTGRVTLYRQNGPSDGIVVLKGEHELKAGDLVMVESGGGGGYGPPADRPLELLKKDLHMGYVSPDGAAREYGEARVRSAIAELPDK